MKDAGKLLLGVVLRFSYRKMTVYLAVYLQQFRLIYIVDRGIPYKQAIDKRYLRFAGIPLYLKRALRFAAGTARIRGCVNNPSRGFCRSLYHTLIEHGYIRLMTI